MKKFLKTKKILRSLVWRRARGRSYVQNRKKIRDFETWEEKKRQNLDFTWKIKMRKFQFLFQPLMNVFCCCCYYCHFCLPYSLDRQMNRILVSANESIPVSANESILVSANESILASANKSFLGSEKKSSVVHTFGSAPHLLI